MIRKFKPKKQKTQGEHNESDILEECSAKIIYYSDSDYADELVKKFFDSKLGFKTPMTLTLTTYSAGKRKKEDHLHRRQKKQLL